MGLAGNLVHTQVVPLTGKAQLFSNGFHIPY
jgi:hypothetical protein